MGPRLCSRGDPPSPPVATPAEQASMGPRLCSRGDWSGKVGSKSLRGGLQWGRGFVAAETHDNGETLDIPPLASMGPRLCSRGDPPRAGGLGGLVWLQWGRGFVAAETAIAQLEKWVSDVELQWGRGFVAAETRNAPASLL